MQENHASYGNTMQHVKHQCITMQTHMEHNHTCEIAM